MTKEFYLRFLTSTILILLLIFMLKYSVVLITILLLLFVVSWLEFNILKIFTKKTNFNFKNLFKFLTDLFLFL